MNKCIASENGICQNVFGYGLKCNGYSTNCKLKPAYDSLKNVVRGLESTLRKSMGIEGDQE